MGKAPIAARSDKFTAAPRQPTSKGDVVRSLKCTSSTNISVVITKDSSPETAKIAASSPTISEGQKPLTISSKPCSPISLISIVNQSSVISHQS
jgi:hypothetical protein